MLSFASRASSGAIGGEDKDTVEETSSDGFRTGGAEAETTEQAADRLDQDRETVEKLIAAGFKGPIYKMFEGDMWAYALPVILDFLRTGKMMELCASRNVTVSIPPQIREMLHTSPQVREEYAVDIIARSMQ
ncbi:MAG TPA: hypothetical protein VNW94_20400 [Streptosporangiaceae bacterium]|jgi:hypothetical protein|nr:hypothetical protein [Streptosporangiaceae bacterium]